MSQVLVTEQYLDDIADAIRSKNGSESTYTPAQMAQAISEIHTADEFVLVQKTVNANGQYNASDDSADGYSGVRVNVPNSYSASDEGKVVSNGDLVAQTTKQITANGTHDTTTNNSVAVNVPNSYAAVDEGKVVSGGALVGQTSRNVTANGTYDTTENNEVVVNVSGGGSGSKVKIMDQGQISSTSDYQTANFDSSVDFSIFNLLLFELYLDGAIIGKTYIYKEEWQQYQNFINFIIPGTNYSRGYQCRFSYNNKTIASTYYSGSYVDLYVNVYGVII